MKWGCPERRRALACIDSKAAVGTRPGSRRPSHRAADHLPQIVRALLILKRLLGEFGQIVNRIGHLLASP